MSAVNPDRRAESSEELSAGGSWERNIPADDAGEHIRNTTGTLPTIVQVLNDIADELAYGRLTGLHIVWLRNIAKQLDGPHIYFDRRG